MSVIRKRYSSQFKAQVVQELLTGEQTLGQIAAKYNIHPNVITKWRKAALGAMPDAIDEQTQKAVNALKAQHKKEKELLYAQIGRLTAQLNWLKKS
ncbi:MAG: transposase family protein [Chloroflexi bacterium]|jgi:transposase|nr:transposase family protein [Chloroflexota bacterium]